MRAWQVIVFVVLDNVELIVVLRSLAAHMWRRRRYPVKLGHFFKVIEATILSLCSFALPLYTLFQAHIKWMLLTDRTVISFGNHVLHLVLHFYWCLKNATFLRYRTSRVLTTVLQMWSLLTFRFYAGGRGTTLDLHPAEAEFLDWAWLPFAHLGWARRNAWVRFRVTLAFLE